MIVMTIPKKEAEIMNKVKQSLRSLLMDIANGYGINWKFVTDSKDINDSIDHIEYAMARICTKVKSDKQLIEDHKRIKGLDKEFGEKLYKSSKKLDEAINKKKGGK